MEQKENFETIEIKKNYDNVVSIFKREEDKQIVSGVVLEPDTIDAQKTRIKAEVIEKAARNFLAKYNKKTKLGLQHSEFKKRFELLESSIAQSDYVVKDKVIKKGSWVIVVKVLDKEVWKKIKEGKITGFSIGGKAKVKKIKAA